MTAKRKCSERVPEGGRSISFYPCQRPATVERDCKWWCWQHDPERIEADKKKRRAEWKAEMARDAAKYARIARNARLGSLVTEELAALLEYLAEGIDCLAPTEPGVPTPTKTDDARATAARIREALALEVNDEN